MLQLPFSGVCFNRSGNTCKLGLKLAVSLCVLWVYPVTALAQYAPPNYGYGYDGQANEQGYGQTSPQQTPGYAPAQPQNAYTAFEQLYEKANQLYQQGSLSQAIETLERALPLVNEASLGPVYNNLAVYYIKRGNYFLSQRQLDNALIDYLEASYLLDAGWPEGQAKSQHQQDNTGIAEDNVVNAYRQKGLDAQNAQVLSNYAQALRQQGKFKPALQVLEQVQKLQPSNASSLRAMGDLFLVLNRPDKAKVYYGKLQKLPGAALSEEVLLRLGNAQYKTQDIQGAIETLNQVLAMNPENPGALNILESVWGQELRLNPNSVAAHANMAAILQKRKQFQPALNHYQTAEQLANAQAQRREIDPELIKQIRINMGTLYEEQRDFTMAERAYDSILEIDRQSQKALYHKAHLYQVMGKNDAAVKAYHQLLAVAPENQEAHRELLELIMKQPNPQQVGVDLEGYANRFSKNAIIQAKAAEYFHEKKDLDKATRYYQQAIVLEPNNAAHYANLGAAYNAQGKSEQAMQAFDKAITLEPNNETYKVLKADTTHSVGYEQFTRAIELQNRGQYQDSIPLLEKALETMNSNADVRLAYAVALQQTRQYSKAAAQYEDLMRQYPQSAEYPYYLGTVYHQEQKLDKARTQYERAVSLKPDYTEAKDALNLIAQSEAEQGLNQAIQAYNQQKYPQAAKMLDEVLRKNPKDPLALYYQGLVLTAQKQPKKAATYYRDAIVVNENFKDAYYALGVALDESQDPTGAKKAYEKFVELARAEKTPENDDFLKYALQRIKH